VQLAWIQNNAARKSPRDLAVSSHFLAGRLSIP